MAPVITDRGSEKYVHGQVVAELHAWGQRRGYCQDMIPELGFFGTTARNSMDSCSFARFA